VALFIMLFKVTLTYPAKWVKPKGETIRIKALAWAIFATELGCFSYNSNIKQNLGNLAEF